LTFDLFGTVLDLEGSLTPALDTLLSGRFAAGAAAFWKRLRYRQRIEQYQDSLMMLGHGGYLETVRRTFSYVARGAGFTPTAADYESYLAAWERLDPFPECRAALERLRGRYRLVALSNGDAPYLQRLVAGRIRVAFDAVISVDAAGAFKPHPAVYRVAARELHLEVGELAMVSANSFDVLGARTCGLRGIYVDRYRLPYEETAPQYLPDATVSDFDQLSALLLDA
jgi:2-haloacid dehalogenase